MQQTPSQALKELKQQAEKYHNYLDNIKSFSIFIGNDTPVTIKGTSWYNATITFLMKKYSLDMFKAFDMLMDYPKTILINSRHVVLGDIIVIQND